MVIMIIYLMVDKDSLYSGMWYIRSIILIIQYILYIEKHIKNQADSYSIVVDLAVLILVQC